jgi:Lon protease-like protein
MFPLAILPLPGEMVPLHIFEPRYKQLLQDAEANDISFGIFFNNTINDEKVGSLMKLESVLKRYPTGEADIIVKCYDLFTLEKLTRTFKSKLYPGGEVQIWNESITDPVHAEVEALFAEYLKRRSIKRHIVIDTIFGIAQELNLELNERYQLVTAMGDLRERFLKNQLAYKIQVLQREEKSKDVYHLN